MKKLIYLFFIAALTACSSGDREAKDQTNPAEENISPNQTVTEEEQTRKDSTGTDPIIPDSARESQSN